MNDAHAQGPPLSAPSGVERAAAKLLRRVCTSNPFYVISACLVLAGLRMSFDPGARVFQTWVLLAGLAGYTVLLACTAWLLVRYNNVWEDIRTILLLVVLMFVTMSVIFDDVLLAHRGRGIACYLGGLLFAVLVSEGLLRGMGLRLPVLFRTPYYALLALFFLYPIALSPVLRSPDSAVRLWATFGFSTVAGLVSLTLLPAIWRGPSYVKNNGSPWRWPLYPWVLFGFLGLGICARTYYLCVSMHAPSYPQVNQTIFGVYFLVPFLLAVAVLLLEIGVASERPGAVSAALVAPIVLIVLATVGHRDEAVYRYFLGMLVHRLGGTPLFLTVILAGLYYVYAALRRVPVALEGVSASLLLLSVIGPNTLELSGLTTPRIAPLLAVGGLQVWLALSRRSLGRWLAATACFVAAATIGIPVWLVRIPQPVLAFHLALGCVLFLSACFDSGLARFLRGTCLMAIVCASVVWLQVDPMLLPEIPPRLLSLYPLVLSATALGYGFIVHSRGYRIGAAMALGCWLAATGWQLYGSMRRFVIGIDQIAWGLAFFGLAAFISLVKAGAIHEWVSQWRAKRCRTTD
jgi:hypothetical protein